MASSQAQQVTKQGLERSRLSLVIHNVNTQIDDKDIEKIIMSKIGKPLPKIESGNIYVVNGRTLRKIFLNFKQEAKLNELMKSRPIKYGNEELIISRHNPKNIPLSGIITCALLLKISKTLDDYGLEKKLAESDINKYFGKFDKVIYCQWLNEYEAILQFNSYDIVDQIILSDISHVINGINVHIEKTREIQKKNMIEIAQHPYCIHVTNIPNDVTSEELSSIFDVPVAHIVLQPGCQLNQHLVSNDQLNSEAWIKLIGNEKQTRDLAIKISNKNLRDFEMHFDVIPEPFYMFELCREFEKGLCRFSSKDCHYKHITCDEPDNCKKKDCHCGHSRKRQITSNRQTQNCKKNLYRVRISNLPSTTTEEQLKTRLNISDAQTSNIILPKDRNRNALIVAYFICQPSEKYLRSKIHQWHNGQYSANVSNKIKCQIEINGDLYDWDDKTDIIEKWIRNQNVSSMRITTHNNKTNRTKYPPWYPGEKESSSTLSHSEQLNSNDPKCIDWNMETSTEKNLLKSNTSKLVGIKEFPAEWRPAKEILSKDPMGIGITYSLINRRNSEIKATIKIYSNDYEQSLIRSFAQHQQTVLKEIEGLNGVPKIIDANVNNTKNNTPWIIMGNVEGVTLHDFIPTTSIDLHNALIITLKLLHTVKQINRRNVIHRNINPHNIIIDTSSIKENNQNQSSFENINLVLIDFDLAYIDQQTNEHNQKMGGMFYSDSIDLINPLKCKKPQSNQIFYRVPQIEKRSMINHIVKNEQDDNLCRSSTIDTSHIGAILFWLITKSYPRESRDIDKKAPHEKNHHIRIIEEELTRASGVWKGKEKRHPLEQHLYLIFDRAFANPDKQWPIEELEYQLELTLQLTKKTNEEEEEEYSLPSMSFKNEQKESLSNIPILTIGSSLQLALFIDSIKRQVEQYYDTLHWSNSEINEWSIKGQQVKHHDILHFQKQQYKTSLEIEWNAIINDKKKLDMNIKTKVNQNTVIDLPLGVWQQYNTDNINNDIRKNVLIELKNLVDVLYYKKNILSV
ncbi:unnamed protein product [Rotaria socialis]